MSSSLLSIRFTLRAIGRNPGIMLAVVLTLALGIGLNVAIFSIVYAILLRPLPYEDSDRLVQIWGQMLSRNIPFHFVPYPDYAEWKAQSRAFEFISAYRPSAMNITNRGEPRRISSLLVNADFFPMAGVPLLHGRGFLVEEDRPGARSVAVMNHSLWQEVFGSDPNMVGQSLDLDGKLHTVVGILPPGFQLGGADVGLYIPLAASSARTPQSMSLSVGAYARLKHGIGIKAAQTEIDTISGRLNAQFPGGLGRSARVWGIREFMVRDVRLSLWILMGAVALVLLMACTNVANVMLARTASRRHEMALRSALGASRRRIIRQMLNESIVLSVAGGIIGVLLANWTITALVRTHSDSYPLLRSASVNTPVLAFTLVISVLTGIFFGTAPAIAVARQAATYVLQGWLKESSQTLSGGGANKVRSALVAVEAALALILLITAGLLIRSFMRLQQVDPGFQAKGVLTASITLPQNRYPAGPKRLAFFDGLLQALRSAPGVEIAGMVDILPLSGSNAGVGFLPEGRPAPRPSEVPIVWMRHMSSGYFRSMSIPILAGRQFEEADKDGVPPVAIVNRTLAQRFWPNEEAIGKRFRIGGTESTPITIIGVAGDVRHTSLLQAPDAEIFMHYRQITPPRATITLRTDSGPSSLAAVLRQAVASMDKELPIAQVQTMEHLLLNSISSRRLTMLLLSTFAGAALLLSAIGIYGVISYAVSQRTHEIGIRRALGAPNRHVLQTVARKPILLALAGEAVGMAAALALRRLIDSQLYGSSSMDNIIFTAVPLLLTSVALIAACLASWRATRVSPLIALRRE